VPIYSENQGPVSQGVPTKPIADRAFGLQKDCKGPSGGSAWRGWNWRLGRRARQPRSRRSPGDPRVGWDRSDYVDTSPAFISLHDAIALTSFPVPHRCAGRGGRRLVDTPGVGGSSGDSRREQPSGDAVVPVTSSTSQTQRLPSKRMDLGCKMVADGLSEGLGEGAQGTMSLQISGGPQGSRTPDLRRKRPSS
jgi:hypothetical protein